jgi:hypothetical protein
MTSKVGRCLPTRQLKPLTAPARSGILFNAKVECAIRVSRFAAKRRVVSRVTL